MDCKGAEACVQPYIDGTLGDRELGAYLQHVRSCAPCRRNLQTYFSMCYLLEYVDKDEAGELSYDMRKVLEEDMRRNEHRLRIRMVLRTIRHLAVIVGEVVTAGAMLWILYSDIAEAILKYWGLF